MSWIRIETLMERRKFIDYIYGLLRHEMHKGQDDPKRLEVLSKIHYDLLYVENLENSEGWKKKVKDKDELAIALDNLRKSTERLETITSPLSKLDEINSSMNKKDILEIIESVKKEIS